jgi:DNA mismatch endonuclease (patch repair protein)
LPDTFTPQQRSAVMAKVKNRDTSPELTVRKLLHRLGYRFRVQRRDLPGTPDIVLPKYRTAIFAHGCFWHGHPDCKRAARPTSNTDFWNEKIDKNIARDAEAQRQLEALGWRVLVVWQCQVRDLKLLEERLRLFLSGGTSHTGP